jgi:hypothetical protein
MSDGRAVSARPIFTTRDGEDDPRHDAARVAGYLCFFNERVDLVIDGDLQPRPRTPWSTDPAPEDARVEEALRYPGG